MHVFQADQVDVQQLRVRSQPQSGIPAAIQAQHRRHDGRLGMRTGGRRGVVSEIQVEAKASSLRGGPQLAYGGGVVRKEQPVDDNEAAVLLARPDGILYESGYADLFVMRDPERNLLDVACGCQGWQSLLQQ